MAKRSHRIGSRAAALAGVAVALLMAVVAPRRRRRSLPRLPRRPVAGGGSAGRLARHLRRRLPRADAGSFPARPHHLRPQARRQRRAGRVHQVGARVPQSQVSRFARRAGTQVPQGAREGHPQHREEHRRRPLHHGRHLGPRDRLRHATSCRTTRSACWRRRRIPVAARTSSASRSSPRSRCCRRACRAPRCGRRGPAPWA